MSQRIICLENIISWIKIIILLFVNIILIFIFYHENIQYLLL
jgi:hypothetical protein